MIPSTSTSLSPLPSFTCSNSLFKPKTPRYLQVRSSQSFRHEEGNPSNMVDANMGVLRARMEEVMKNERLMENTPKRRKHYNSKSGDKNADDDAAMIMGTMEVMGSVTHSFALVFLFGSLSIVLVSLLVHLCTL